MDDIIISVESLSKRYKLGMIGATTLRDSVERAWHRLRGRDWQAYMGKIGAGPRKTLDSRLEIIDQGEGETLDTEGEADFPISPKSKVQCPMSSPNGLKSDSNDLWALKDVSFEVKRGEVLGVIGRNGAGKSTLLKILTRITEPTSGRAIMRGRVASLLEVGTGFHPELTGRENIYLNGAILGMKRAEITRKFDEIVAFAETERFIDTPVKRYSSGMYVRLAFAVAAHLDPEILLVDEVLAVGDAAFQKKCLGKMGEVARTGRTVLFVSHNMTAVSALCARAIIINNGRVSGVEGTESAVSRYMSETRDIMQNIPIKSRRDRMGDQSVCIQDVTFHNQNGDPVNHITSGQNLRIRFHYLSEREMRNASVMIAFNIRNGHGQILANLNSVDTGDSIMSIARSGYFDCIWPQVNLRAGTYSCTIFCQINSVVVDWVPDAFVLPVEDGDFFGSGRRVDENQGDVLIKHRWQ